MSDKEHTIADNEELKVTEEKVTQERESEENIAENKAYALTKQAETHTLPNTSLLAAKEIENHYKEGIIAYSEGIHKFTLEISKLKATISTEKKLIEKEEETLSHLERTLGYDEQLLQKYNDHFSKKIDSLQELNREYKEMLNDGEYLKLDKRKQHELQEILDEIEELELTLLHKELERTNLLIKLEPKRRLIIQLEGELNALQLDRAYFESTKLQQIALLPKQNPKDDTVDTEVVES